MNPTRGSRAPLALAAAVYLLASVALTWPTALHPDAVLFGDFGDMRGRAWGLWARSQGFLDGAVNPMLGAPFGLAVPKVVSQPLWEWPGLALTMLRNEIAAINAMTIAAFALTATATFALLERLLEDRPAAFFGGLAFGFCPAAVLQTAGGHGEFALNAFVALFLLALFNHRRRRDAASAWLVALSFAAVALTSLYIAFFTVLFALFFAAWDAATAATGTRARLFRGYAICGAIALLVLLPFEYRAVHEQLTASPEAIAKAGHSRDFGQLTVYSARWWEYLTPSIDHPVLGPHVEALVRNRLHHSNAFEQTLYLGWVLLALLAAGAILWVTRRFAPDLRRLFFFFGAGASWMLFISLPPRVLGDMVPTVSYFAHGVAPMFRVYARAGLLAHFLMACAAAVVLAHLARHAPPQRYRLAVAVLASVLAFEYWSVPPWYAQPVDRPPEVYAWLASEPGDAIVAEYPMAPFDEAAFYNYPFWQRVHHKRLVNGATPADAAAWQLFEKVRNLSDAETPERLAAAGVKYVIVHRDMYPEGPIPRALKRYYPPDRAALTFNGGVPEAIPPGLSLYREFGGDQVYLIERK